MHEKIIGFSWKKHNYLHIVLFFISVNWIDIQLGWKLNQLNLYIYSSILFLYKIHFMSSKSSLIRRLFYQYYSDLFYRISFKFNFSWHWSYGSFMETYNFFHALCKRLDFIFFFLSFFKKRSLFIIKRGD